MISALAGRANKTASQRKSRWGEKRRFVLDQAMMQGHGVQRFPAEQIYAMFPKMVCEDHLADPDTVCMFDNYLGVFGRRNPPCNAEDKTVRRTHHH